MCLLFYFIYLFYYYYYYLMRKTKDTARDGAAGHGQVGHEEELGGGMVGKTNGFSIWEWS